MPTVPTFAVREIDVSRHNGGPRGAPLTANVGTVGMNGLIQFCKHIVKLYERIYERNIMKVSINKELI